MFIKGAILVPHPPIIFPEIGKGRERKIQKTIDAYESAARQVASWLPDTIVVISPHSILYSDYFHISPGKTAKGDMKQFGVTSINVKVDYDSEFIETLSGIAVNKCIMVGTLGEKDKNLDHGTIVPLRFLEKAGVKCPIVRVGLSGLSPNLHYQLGKCIKQAAEKLNRNVVLVASGDLSHKLLQEGPYGFAEEGPEFDLSVTKAMKEGDFLRFLTYDHDFRERAAECGLGSFQIMAGAFDGVSVKSKLLSYEGPFGVGYGVAIFTPKESDNQRRFDLVLEQIKQDQSEQIRYSEDEYVRLARQSLETYITTGSMLEISENLSDEMLKKQAGVFVSLKKDGKLRGCIGTIEPATSNIAEEILRNAISAGCRDPRFDPVEAEELDELVYSVDVLSLPEPAASPADLDVKKYGVIVSSRGRRGLLLPNLEGICTVREQISIAKQKAGIPKNESCTLERFQVVRHK